MAGTGKTALTHRLQHHCADRDLRSYFINLDPAVTQVPFTANIDIRDTVSYKDVMQQYQLGPNGAIMTCLNLFATKVHQVISLLEARKSQLDWVVVDTPGQVEVFTWSASGQLIVDALSAVFPTVVLFTADVARCLSPQTFMSTMLYASGIYFKQSVPLIVVFNKADVADADTVRGWMCDHLALEEAVLAERGATEEGHYAGTLTRSMSLFLHPFYQDLSSVVVSAASGAGIADLEEAIMCSKAEAVSMRAEIDALHEQETNKMALDQADRLAKDAE